MTEVTIFSFLTTILLGLTSLLTQGYAASGNDSDHQALLSFKAMINDDPNQVLSSWNDSVHFCDWQGITCGLQHRRVTMLELKSKGLVGSISPAIVNLTFLRWISLGDNGFHGKIPDDIALLFRLQHVNLSHNFLEFEIPTNLTMFSNLQVLDFSHNNLVGRIPTQLSSCQKLMSIDISSNNLSRSIPPSLGNLSSLQSINLRYNNLAGRIPQDLGRLANLRKLLLEVNALSGTVPSSIYNLSSLLLLGMSVNQLQGSLPSDLGITLPHLQALDAGGNSFTGPLPFNLVNASELFWLDFTENQFTGQFPSNLGSLGRLMHFSLGRNNLESSDLGFLTSLTNCSNLVFLGLDTNNFWGHLPESISNLSTKLTFFSLGFNGIGGSLPSGIGNLASLINFGLENNLLTGNIPSTIGMLPKLQSLDFFSNKLSGTIPSSLGNLSNLYSINLSNNSFSGSIPWSLGDIQSLQILYLAQNNLSGMIPSHLPVNLRVFNLSYNSLSGPLPVEIQDLVNLNVLDVTANQLYGEIPITINHCERLLDLMLAGNHFQGTIPSSLSSLRGVVYIDLSSNHFRGKIPNFLSKLPSLQFLNLSFNDFEGDVPKDGFFANSSAFSIEGNKELCGGFSELKLPPCPIQGSAKRKQSYTLIVILITFGVSFCLILVLSLIVLYNLRMRKSRKRTSLAMVSTRRYWLLKVTYEEIFKATDGFSEANLLGSGRYGSVYKGSLGDEGTSIAVKVLNLQQLGAYKSFEAECEALRMIRHRNILKILTSCSSADFKGDHFLALIFEFMSNGSLEERLHRRNLNVIERINIATDVASALDYLHHHCQPPIVHCDIKPSNILLDDQMSARISDFGLARVLTLGTHETSSVCVKGTLGYAPPEYGMSDEASTSGDAYSYGILLLELFTGRRPTDETFNDDLDLHNFVKAAMPERVFEILDPSLLSSENIEAGIISGTMMLECLISVFTIGISCSSKSPGNRMNIKAVVKELEKIKASLAWRNRNDLLHQL